MTPADATLTETAHAKLNLALHVRAREPDGYHRIETLFVFCEDGDRLTAAPAEGLELRIDGPFGAALAGPTDDNLVLRAAARLREACGVTAGARIRLDKRLPVASGIGGGSADAAAALRLLVRLWQLTPAQGLLEGIAGELGADVPACLASRALRGDGRGDRLAPLDDADELAGMPVLLMNPRVAISTAAVFKAWDGTDHGALGHGGALEIARAGRSDLQPPAVAQVPEIATLVTWLEARPGVMLARMSGSGATCFALFENKADRDAAAAAAERERPDDWRFATRLL